MPTLSNHQSAWVRKVTPEEVLPLRAQVLRPHHPLMACVFDGDHAAQAAHFGAGIGESPILAVGTIYPEAFPASSGETFDSSGREPWRLRGMATLDEARSQGLGGEILSACIDYVLKNSRHPVIWAHARTGALEFYRRHGFRTLGVEYTLPGVGPHYMIIRDELS